MLTSSLRRNASFAGLSRHAAQFRKNLEKDGFTMMQNSVYVRDCASKKLTVHEHRIRMLLPPDGNVSMLSITDKQFGDMHTCYGKVERAKLDVPQQLELYGKTYIMN